MSYSTVHLFEKNNSTLSHNRQQFKEMLTHFSIMSSRKTDNQRFTMFQQCITKKHYPLNVIKCVILSFHQSNVLAVTS